MTTSKKFIIHLWHLTKEHIMPDSEKCMFYGLIGRKVEASFFVGGRREG